MFMAKGWGKYEDMKNRLLSFVNYYKDVIKDDGKSPNPFETGLNHDILSLCRWAKKMGQV